MPQNTTIKYLVQQIKTKLKKNYQLSNIMSLGKLLLMILILNHNLYYPVLSQLSGREKTMEQFLDRLLHESVYDKRIRPFYTDNKSKKIVFPELKTTIFEPRWFFLSLITSLT